MAAVLLMCLVLGLVSGNAYAQQQKKCKTQFAVNAEFPKKAYDFIVAYNVSSTKNVLSCVDVLETYQGPTKENFAVVYTEGGVKYNRSAISSFTNNYGSFYYTDNPDQKHDFYADVRDNGVSLNYICNGDNEFIWVFYDNVKDLSKEAEEVAKELTDNPADYKISRDGC